MDEAKLRFDAAVHEEDDGGIDLPSPRSSDDRRPNPHLRILPILVTMALAALASAFGWVTWTTYMDTPWTRDGTVRVHVVTMAPEVAGRIVELPVVDNEFVHKGDLLMVIDPINYDIAVRLAEAAVQQAKVSEQNLVHQAQRRAELSNRAISVDEKESYESQALVAHAQYQQALANLDQARANAIRTRIRSPVNGWVTNLLAQAGDFANVGQNEIAVIDADSFWIDGYFLETSLSMVQEGDAATAKLLGYDQVIRGHVEGISHGIAVPNARPNDTGLASVNPIFTWVRLAQRIPVHIHIDKVPDGVRLASGMTATVHIVPHSKPDVRK